MPRLARTKLPLIFLGLAAALVLSTLAMYLMGLAVIRANQSIINSHAVLDDLRETLSTIKDAETGQRGYLLTGDLKYLKPYNAALRRIDENLIDLQAKNLPPVQFAQFRALIAKKLTELDTTIALYKAGKTADAINIVQDDVGMKLMDDLRRLTQTSIEQENAHLRELHRKADQLALLRTGLFALVTLLDLLFLKWVYDRISRETSHREAISQEVARQGELFRVTLASIGDGVIVTDPQGKISYLNPIAETLTGWHAEDAAGKTCGEVFHIINETTREPVESPVDKVLASGLIVGLANHTLLIARNGSELPIDDSGAPIKDAAGIIKGVVLVFRDFSEHKRVENELRSAMDQAETANIAKDNFLATLSHELRTPLTPVLTTLDMWAEQSDLPDSIRADLEMIHRNINLEARLIDDLLDLTRIVRGKLSLNLEVADLQDLVGAVSHMYQSEIQGKRQHFALHLDAAEANVEVDPGRFQQVLLNVLKNAIKFTGESGSIDIAVTNESPGTVTLRIMDTGIGMTPEVMTRLFQPFEQGAAEIVKRYGGLGLGMAISKALVEAQGGTIGAQSPGIGQGSTFTITLPIARKQARPITPPPSMPSNQQPLRILLVEDHEDTAMVLSRLLKRWGHTVRHGRNVAEALTAFSEDKFDLLLSDIGLPDGTGMDLIRKIRETSPIPAVALTGYGMEDDVAKCKEAGFDDHVTKPLNFQRLELILNQVRPA